MYGVPVTLRAGEYTRVAGLDDRRILARADGRHAEGARGRARRRRARCSAEPLRSRLHDAPGRRQRFRAARGAPSSRCRSPARSTPITRCSPSAAGFRAIYLSGGGVAAGSLGLARSRHQQPRRRADRRAPHHRRLRRCRCWSTSTPASARRRSTSRAPSKSLIKSGAGGDAHRGPGRRQALRPSARQGTRVASRRWSTASRRPSTRAPTPTSSIMARTDALAVEGLDAAIERARGLRRSRRRHDLPRGDHRARDVPAVRRRGRRCRSSPTSPSSAQTPLFTRRRAARAPASRIALYPLSAFRAMNKAALNVYSALRRDGTQKNVVDTMQTRDELYDYLGYHAYEQKLDALFAQGQKNRSTTPPTGDRRRRPRRRASSRRNRSRCPASPPATPRCAPSAAPATTCTTAATTSSTSPTTANSRRSRYLLVHGKLPNARRARRLQAQAAARCAACPRRVQDGARALPAGAHPMDVMRTGVLGARLRAAREGRPQRCRARATSPTG